MSFVEAFLEILERPTVWAMVIGMIQFLGPVWIAFLFGLMVGWAWKPRWASLGNCKFDFSAPSSPSTVVPVNGFVSTQSLDSCNVRAASSGSCMLDNGLKKMQRLLPAVDDVVCR